MDKEWQAQDVIEVVERFAPPALAFPDDPIGLQVGRRDRPVRRVWIALDPSPQVISAAVAAQVDLLVTHHELFYRPLTNLDTASWRGRAIADAVAHDLTIYAAHTNLDVTDGGVNDVLAEQLGLHQIEILDRMQNERLRKLVDIMGRTYGIGRVGNLEKPLPLGEFSARVRDVLGLTHIRFGGNPAFQVSRIAVLGGSGGRWAEQALAKGAQVLVTADCDHHRVAEAWQDGLAIVDATHAAMERPVLGKLKQVIETALGDSVDVQVAPVAEDPFQWI